MQQAGERWQSHRRDRRRNRKIESEKLKQTAGEAERSEEAKDCAREFFLAELPEALHIPARLIEAVSVFVFSACELPPDYRETAVPPLPPDSACVIMHRVTTKTNSRAAPTKPSRLFDVLSIPQTVTHLHNH